MQRGLTREVTRKGSSVCASKEKKDLVNEFVGLLKACAKQKDLDWGARTHADILKAGLSEEEPFLASALVNMYAKCGALSKAQRLLDELPAPDAYTWSALITGYAEHGYGEEALSCFQLMEVKGLFPNAVTFASTLKACGSIGEAGMGEKIHREAARLGLLEGDIVLGNSLVDMYAKCGALVKAKQVLDELPQRNVVSWNALITGCALHEQFDEALICFEQMQQEGLTPTAVTYTCLLKACSRIGAAEKGEQVHAHLACQGLLETNVVLGNALVDMYARCGSLVKARWVFDQLPVRDVVSWSSLILGYTQDGQAVEALDCFGRMQDECVHPNEVTFACVLKACGIVGAAAMGEKIHNEISQQGLLQESAMLGNSLIDMYVKCGLLSKAKQALDQLPVRDVLSWCTLIIGYVQHGRDNEAIRSFEQMQEEGHSPNSVIYAYILKSCGSIRDVDMGGTIHAEIARQGFLENDIALGNALVDMYARCGALTKAQEVAEGLPSRNAVSWSVLINGYIERGQCEEALLCFQKMEKEGLPPDAVTFSLILKACSKSGAGSLGEKIHSEIAKQGLLEGDATLGTSLVDLYAKCGELSKAKEVLDGLPARDGGSWSALLSGYAHCGCCEEALNCYEAMQREGFFPNSVMYACILKACGMIGAANKGGEIHADIVRQGLLEKDITLCNNLVDMYVKCGALVKASEVLNEAPVRDFISWATLISGYAQHGHVKETLKCVKSLQEDGFYPDATIFTCVIHACSHSGLVEEGEMYYTDMSTKYGVTPDLKHHSCMVDLFARAGRLDKAKAIIREIPSCDHLPLWVALLSAGRKLGDVNVARFAFEHIVQLDEKYGAAYICMSNVYTAAGMLGDADKIDCQRKLIGAC